MIRRFLFLCAASFLIWSCSGGEDKPQTDAGDNSKIFRYNSTEPITSLDPAFAKNQANIWAVTQLFGGLFELSSDLHEHPAIVDTWDISSDQLTYTFKLRKGVLFHDDDCFPNGKGREVTADDFVYSFKRILAEETRSPGAWVFNDKVLKDKKGNISDTCFKAVDPYTLRIYLDAPFPPFLQILAMPYCYVVPKEGIEKYGRDFARHPVGTGPFRLKSWDESNSLIMVKSPSYWRKDPSHNSLPYLDAVQVSFISDKNQEFLTFQQGKLDFISGIDANTIEQILKKDGSVREEIDQKFTVQKMPYLNTEYLGFQMDVSKYENKKHPFLDGRVRKALSYAINRDELVSFLRNNLGTPARNGFVPAALPSFDEGKVKGYDYNPEEAQKLLKEAGYPDGKGFPEVTLYTTPPYKEMAETLQKQWSSILNVNFKIEINNFAAHQDMVENGKVHFFRGSWLGDYPDEENFLACFYSKKMPPSGPNKTRFNNAEFDRLYEVVHQEKDGWKRHEMYYKMDQLVMNESPVIVLYYDEVLRLMQKNITGLEPDGMNMLRLERVNISKPAEAAQ